MGSKAPQKRVLGPFTGQQWASLQLRAGGGAAGHCLGNALPKLPNTAAACRHLLQSIAAIPGQGNGVPHTYSPLGPGTLAALPVFADAVLRDGAKSASALAGRTPGVDSQRAL